MPRDRNLHAIDEPNAGLRCLEPRGGKTARLVMIGKRESVYPARGGTGDELCRAQQAVGLGGVTVQVVAQGENNLKISVVHKSAHHISNRSRWRIRVFGRSVSEVVPIPLW